MTNAITFNHINNSQELEDWLNTNNHLQPFTANDEPPLVVTQSQETNLPPFAYPKPEIVFPEKSLCSALFAETLPLVEVNFRSHTDITTEYSIRVTLYQNDCLTNTPHGTFQNIAGEDSFFYSHQKKEGSWQHTTITLHQGYWDTNETLDYVLTFYMGDSFVSAYWFSVSEEKTVEEAPKTDTDASVAND